MPQAPRSPQQLSVLYSVVPLADQPQCRNRSLIGPHDERQGDWQASRPGETENTQ